MYVLVGLSDCMTSPADDPQIEELKDYFNEPMTEADHFPDSNRFTEQELLFRPFTTPLDRQQLLSQLPPRQVADRIVTRYFASVSPSRRA